MNNVGVLLRQRATWAIAALLAGITWLQTVVAFESPDIIQRLAYTIVPLIALVATIEWAVLRRSWVTVAALVLAVAPTALSGIALAERDGALAVLFACGAVLIVWSDRLDTTALPTVLATLAVAGVALWVESSDAAPPGVEANLTDVSATVGSALRGAIGSVGQSGSAIPTTAMLTWWVGAGIVVGAALLVRQVRTAAIIPLAVVGFVIVSSAIEWFRGPSNPAGGTWLLSAAVAFTAASVRPDRAPDRRLGRAVVVAGCFAWVAGLAQQVRAVVVDAPPDGDWAFWTGWTLVTTSLDARMLLSFAIVLPSALGALIWRWSGGPRRPRGVNVVGHLSAPNGLGDRARELVGCLRAADVVVGEWDVDHPADGDSPIVYDTTIVVGTAVQTPTMLGHVSPALTDVHLVVGYWFWELGQVPDTHSYAVGLVDEVWAPTRFVRDAYSRATTKPVRLVPLPIAEPEDAAPDVKIPGVDLGDFVFLVSFDHASVMERKNPIAAIEAFRDAFDGDDRTVKLVVKTINGDRHPDQLQRLERATAIDDRISVWDETLTRDEMTALVARADALVTLHRSEGLGLHPADAMWLATPVIATRWSGTLDLMDDDSALLIDAALVPVGELGSAADAYPPDAMWAEADLDQAVAAMRQIRIDPDVGAALGAVARERMGRQPDRASTGRAVMAVAKGWGIPDVDLTTGTRRREPASIA